MFLKNIPVELTRAARNFTAKATSLSPRLKVSAAFLTLCLTVGAVWIQPAFASSAPAPTPASISLSSIADYFWSFFAASNDGHKRPPRVSRGDTEPYSGQRQPQEPIPAAALPCTPTGTELDVPGTYATIQLAINAAEPAGGDKIVVAAGNYTEQLSINKCVTIEGAGVGATNILSPAALTASTVTGFGGYAIVEVRGNSYVTITGVTISGPVPFGGAGRTHGIFVSENATLKMTDSRVTALHGSGGIDGVQDGVGIRAGSTAANTTGNLDLDNVTVDDFQKNGIDVDRTGSSATITNSTVAGIGPTSILAQNGIFADYGADLTVTNSTIKDLSYTPATWASIGIGPYDSGTVVIDNNQFIGVDEGVYAVTSSNPVTPKALSITNNTFSNNLGYGIIYMSHSPVTITDNVIFGSNVGIEGDIFPGQVSTIERNSITQATGTDPVGIYFWDSGTTTNATINVNFNRISSNGAGGLDGIYNDTQNAVNADNNWWGCNAGPGGTGCDAVTDAAAGVTDFSPWLTLTGITADASPIAYNGTSNISGVSLCTNSDSVNVCTVNDHIIDGTPLGYGTNPGTAGSVSPTSSTFVNGVANAGSTFTAGAGPFVGDQTEAVGATLDNQTITTNVVVHDSTPPTFASLARVGGPLTGAATVQFTATFSEPVNAGIANFSVVEGGGVTGASVAAVNCSGNNCTIDVNTGSGSGTLGLTIPTSSGITDTATNPLGGGPYPSSDSFTVDKDVPTGTLVQASGQPDPTGASPVHFTVTFTDPSGSAISGFDATDVVVATGTGTAFNSATPSISVTGSGPYDVAVSGMDQPGQVTITVGAGAVVDAAGNMSADVVEGDNTVYYTSGASTLIVDTDGAASDANFPASCSDSTPTAYTTIQAAINAASNGNTIKVCPGVYEELVDVDKSVSLLGPNTGVNPNTTAPVDSTSAIIRVPDSTTGNPGWSGDTIIYVHAPSVTVDGFTIDGDNPDVVTTSPGPGPNSFNGANVDAGFGLYLDSAGDPKANISNNFVRNFGEMGIFLVGNGAAGNHASTISNNKIDNIPGVGFGQGIHVRSNAWANITGNHLTKVNFGIVVENMNHDSDSGFSTPTVSNNEISSRSTGIRTNAVWNVTSTNLHVTNNTISSFVDSSAGVLPVTNWRGVRIESWQGTVPLTVENNMIRPDKTTLQTAGYTRIDGIWVTNTSTVSPNIAITGNTISNTVRGISQTTPATPTVTCNAIYGNDVGIYVGHDVQFGGTTESYATGGISLSNNSIVGNGIGVQNDQTVGLPPNTGGTSVPATNVDGNFWGSTDGPGPIGTGLGDGRSTFTTNTGGFLSAPAGCAPVISYPTVTIEQTGSQDPTNASEIHFTVQFSAAVASFDASKVRLSGTAGATTATLVSGSGSGPYDVKVTGMSSSGTVIADLYAGAGYTAGGIPSVASTSTDNTVTYDNVAPAVSSIVRDGSTPTNAASVTFTVTFSEAVNNVDTTDFALATTGSIAGANISNVTGSGATRTVTVATGTGDGDIGLNLPAGSDIADDATNTLSNIPFTGAVYTIDRTGPNSAVSPVANPATVSPVDFTVNFGEAVTGFDPTDVTIGGSANPTGFTIDGSYTVHVTGMNQSGTVTVSVNNAGVTDSLGNAGTGASSSSAQFNQQTTPNVQTPLAPTWAYYDDVANAVIPGYDYVYGPNGGPLPAGSARLQSGAGELKGLFTQDYNNTRLADITTLSYSTYVHGAATNEPTLQFNVDFDLTDGNTSYQGRVVYVPSQNGSVSADTWQNWNALTGVFWYSSLSPFAGQCTQSIPCTLGQMLSTHPNMGIAASSNGAIGFRSEQNSNSNVDNFVIGVNSANTVVNFEPAGAMVSTPSSANGWFYWEDDDDHLVTTYDYVFGPLGGPLPVGSARVASGTTPGDQRKGLFTFQYRGTRLDQLTTLKYSTYAATAGDVPYFQISVDFTGTANPGYQGRLVYVPSENGTFTANTWQTWDMLASTAKFYYSSGNYSPNGDGCLASEGNHGCTLATILSLHPNARVMPNGDPGHPDPNNTWGVIGVRTDPGKVGNVDNIIIGVNGANTTFNFEPAGTTVVSSAGMQGWDTRSSDNTAVMSFRTGAGTPPLGNGSAQFVTAADGNQYSMLYSQAFAGVRLDSITSMGYSTYVHANTGGQAPYLVLRLDNDGDGNYDDRLYFEPTYQDGTYQTNPIGPALPNQCPSISQCVDHDAWQTWNVVTGGWHDGSGPGGTFFGTLAQYVALHANATIVNYPSAPPTSSPAGVYFVAGAGAPDWNNFSGNVDAFTIGVNGAVNTFDFEAVPPSVSIAGNPGNATEGNNVSFTVSLTGDSPSRTLPVTVVVNTSDGTATGGTDYTSAVSQVVTFAPGVSSQTVSVATATDNIAEGDETFTATLSNAVNAGLAAASSATGTINDGAGYIAIGGQITAYTGGAGIPNVTVTLTGTSNGSPITVTTTTDGSGNYNFNTGISTTGQYSVAPTVAPPYVYDPESIYYINPSSSVTNANFVGYTNDNPRNMTIGNVVQSQVGANVVVPVTLNAIGTEQGGSFVLNFDTSILHYVSASAPPGTNLVVSAGPGAKTVSFSKLGAPYTGTVTLNFTFSATPGNALNTPVTFANPKRISNSQGIGVPTVWNPGTVIFAQGNEGDISDGSTGGFTDGYVDAADISRILSLIVGDATPNPNVNEFQRADAGPFLPGRGDGCIDALDLTAIMLYSVGDLPTTPATGPVGLPCPAPLLAKGNGSKVMADTIVRFVGSRATPGSNIDVQVELAAQGIENSVTFTLNYDATILDEFPTITLGPGAPNSSFFSTNGVSRPGKTTIVFSAGAGVTIPAGDRIILNLRYHVKSSAPVGTYPVIFGSTPTNQRVSRTDSTAIPATWEDGVIEILLAPTAATSSVGGQVRMADGRGIGNTVVTLTGTDGSVRRALTNQMGFYRIDNVPTGATYVLGATSKRYTFDSRVVTVGDNITDADITPRE